jgi:tRNA threonylcarbamoyladenosine biosynthesis protein TsaB
VKLLAIDTATEQCSVAVRSAGKTIEQCVLTTRGHADLLLPMIEAVLTEAGIGLAELEGLAFGQGPGAFTGVRIAAGVIQGLSLGSGLPVVGISNLAAVAQQVAAPGEEVLVCMDARMNEVYWGLFRIAEDGDVVLLNSEQVSPPLAVTLEGRSIVMGAGTGFRAYPVLKEQFATMRIDDAALPRAGGIAFLAERALLRGEGRSAAEALPVYLRDQVASITPA